MNLLFMLLDARLFPAHVYHTDKVNYYDFSFDKFQLHFVKENTTASEKKNENRYEYKKESFKKSLLSDSQSL